MTGPPTPITKGLVESLDRYRCLAVKGQPSQSLLE